ncbi:MAG: FAD-dependent monooxygenase [Pseudomonadota bacterium]|nr:FAD-dependent monooxygenase [Pseudomonadota bacterium]
MRIDIIGGGPAGLFFAILAKKSLPAAMVDVVERNAADDTFGFGIVLSDETLHNLQVADEPVYRDIAANFAYWDDIFVHFRGDVLRSSGHGFSGIKRITLLHILQRRAQQLGVRVRYETEDAGIEAHRGAQLIVAADGANSAIREQRKEHFAPAIDVRSNRFVWLGANLSLPGFTYSFRENEHGLWNMHAYMYAPGESTIVIETTDDSWRRSGLAVDDEQATAAYVERLFAPELQGARVLTNRSLWRQFPTIALATWHGEEAGTHLVLVGDAAHTAHYAIGSGTKLALEDAIALHRALIDAPDDIGQALANYETVRRDEVGRIQHSANVSLAWFENVRRFWKLEPWQFNVSLLTRSKQITYENLKVRDAALVANVTEQWNRREAGQLKVQPPVDLRTPPMFAPLRLRDLWLANRVVVSPMAQYSAINGTPNDWHFAHYAERAKGGAGLLFVEMTCVSAHGRITPGCTGLYADEHVGAWQRIVEFVHRHSAAKIAMQIGHSGRKGSTQVGWRRMDWPLDEEDDEPNWPLVSASAIAYRQGVNQAPRAATRADMDELIEQFCSSAMMAEQAGFDLLELHMAHGYLLASFLSPITNQRSDHYGGSLANRLRFPLELFRAVRTVWPQHKPMSVRLSATDWVAGGTTGADSVLIARAFKEAGCDLFDVSTGQTDPSSKPVYGRMFQASFSEQIRLEVDIATMAVGAVTSADQVNTLLISGRADLVALARPHLADPYFTLHAAAQLGYEGVTWPSQYLSGAQQLHALHRRARDDAARKSD